jgi:hypothetical protein
MGKANDNPRTSNGGTAVSPTGSASAQGEGGSCRDAYDKGGRK